MIYFDTSDLLKCYLPEHGFALVRTVFDQHGSAACCSFGKLEFVSGLRRAGREGRLPQSAIVTALTILGLDEPAGRWVWFAITARLLETAQRTVQGLPPDVVIRAADALHLICARENGCQQLFTNDRHMLAAAPHFGVQATNVVP
jgi:predicted nucleic acid-binding protein